MLKIGGIMSKMINTFILTALLAVPAGLHGSFWNTMRYHMRDISIPKVTALGCAGFMAYGIVQARRANNFKDFKAFEQKIDAISQPKDSKYKVNSYRFWLTIDDYTIKGQRKQNEELYNRCTERDDLFRNTELDKCYLLASILKKHNDQGISYDKYTSDYQGTMRTIQSRTAALEAQLNKG
jgi:hypothetical protein